MSQLFSDLETTEILHHMGEHDLPMHAVAPPIFQSSIFCFDSFEDFHHALKHESTSYIYSRGNNPTVNLCESKIAALEHAERAKLVSSGVAAISSAIMAFMNQGDHAVCVGSSYDWTKHIFSTYLKRFGCEVTYVEGSTIEEFEAAIRPNTKVIYLESPATFTFTLQPLRKVAELAKSHGIKTIIDNTWSTPIYQNPIDFGIDLVVHSASKYFGGNSDLVAGVICGSDEDITRIFYSEFMPLGPAPDPFMAWLILRNIRTLHIRMPVHYKNALGLAEYLESRDDVESVNYPLLPSFPQYELAKEQLRGGSGLFSFRLKTRDREKVKAITNHVKCFKLAVSWGGYESLFDPSLVKFADDQPCPDDRVSLIRIHAGLEDLDMLKKDLGDALDSVR